MASQRMGRLPRLRAAVALQVHGDHLAAPAGQRGQDGREHVARHQAAVQEQERIALAPDLVVVVDAPDAHAARGAFRRGRRRGATG